MTYLAREKSYATHYKQLYTMFVPNRKYVNVIDTATRCPLTTMTMEHAQYRW